MAIFENVTTLAQPHASQRASNLDAVVATLRSRCQMSLHVWQMDPHWDDGGPQLRPRLWMVAVKLELLHKLGFSEESASDKLCSLMNKLVGSHPTPLSEVLYAESCPFLVNANRNALAKRLCAEGDLRTATMVLDGCLPNVEGILHLGLWDRHHGTVTCCEHADCSGMRRMCLIVSQTCNNFALAWLT